MRNRLQKQTKSFLVLILFLSIQCWILPANVFGQQTTLSGIVTDESGQALPGVSAVIAGTTTGTVTDVDGKYSLSFSGSNVKIVFSYLGYTTQEVETNGKTTLNITLTEDVKLIEEVVVVGYGKSNRKDITGAVSSVKASEMNVGVLSSPAQMLQGKVPGLSVTRSGDPNQSPAIVLRGQSTLREGAAMEPFYVIDGVPGASIDLVAPDDIVSMDILRDASSTAIYGSRAANGVIMITTKRPQGEQGYLTYNGYVAIESVSNRLDMMTGDDLRAYTNNTLQAIDDVPGVNTNWQDEVQRTAVSYNQNISFGGAGKSTSYGVNLNYMDNQGIIQETGFKRYIMHANVEQKLIENRLTVGLNLNYSNTQQSLIYPEVLRNMLSFLPTVPVKKEDGTYSENFQRTGAYGNPVAMLYNDLDKRRSTISLGNAYLRLNILPGLTYNLDFSIQDMDNKKNTFNSSTSSIRKGTGGYAVRNNYVDSKTILETHINYDKTFGKHDMKVMLGYSWEEDKTGNGFQSANSGFPSDDLTYHNLGLGNSPDKVSDDDRYGTVFEKTLRMISFYGRANYQYDNRYLVQVSVRRDGSSAFGINNRWGTFPAASVGWKMHNERFMQNQRLFSELRWRASGGVSGNTIGFDPMISRLKYGKQGTTSVNGKDIISVGPVQNANPDLKWESTSMYNVGLDFGILDGRLSGTIEYYYKLTSDLIWDYAVPITEYLVPTLTTNVGEISNKGIELQLNARIVESKDFKWNSTVTFSRNVNKVESITNDKFKDTYRLTGTVDGSGQSFLTSQIIKEGSPIGTFYLPKYAGPNADGVTMFYDADGNQTAQPTSKDYYEFTEGSAQPDILYGWQNSFSYKKIDLGFFFRGVSGNYILNATRANYFKVVEASQFNILAEAANAPRQDIRAHFTSDRYIENGSYLRLDNITLGYTINPGIGSLKSIRIYCTANNVFVVTGYKGIDPEISLGGLAPGIDNLNFYPKTRSIMFGLVVNIN